MKVIYDIQRNHKKIKNSIKKYGCFAEHNYFNYIYDETFNYKNILFDFSNNKILLFQFNKKNSMWNLFPNGILAPKNEKLDLLLESINYILKKQSTKKIWLEISGELRKGIINKFKPKKGFNVSKKTYILYWPVYNMDLWSPRLKGSKWKKLRNIRNRFCRMNKVSIKDSKYVPKEELKKILFAWLKRRKLNDRVNKDYYLNLINNNFKGLDMAKTMYVNGKPCTITGGWKIPNSNNYYSSIGILDYSYPGLGEAANIDDLNRLKRKGFDYADFGGSERALLYSKKKFRPDKIYKTYIFSIVRR